MLITNPISCEIRKVIRFLNVRKRNAIEIYHQLCETYVPYEQTCGRPSLQTNDLIEYVNAKVKENRYFMISNLTINFPEVCRTMLIRIMTK